MVVCPVRYDSRGDLNRNRSCSGGWLKHALQRDDTTQRLGDALGKRADTKLDDGLIYELQWGKDEPRLRFLHALEPYPVVWQPAVRSFLERLGTHPAIGEDEAMRVWTKHPEYHGAATYIFTFHHKDWGHSADEHFADVRKHGFGIDAATFGSFLDEGPGAFTLVPLMWRSLTPGWSRADVVTSHLGRLLDDPLPISPTYAKPDIALAGIVKRFCDDKNLTEITKLHDTFVARAASHPGDARVLENVIADTAIPTRCAVVGTAKDDQRDLNGD